MKNTITKIVMTSCLLISANHLALASASTTYYCAPTTDITFKAQQVAWAPYAYSSPEKIISAPVPGIQLSLSGEGSASKAVELQSAVWSDRELLCNYNGLTDQQTSETMVMFSDVLKESTCHFPNNKTFCDSNNPLDCPMICSI